jgi:Zn-finger nucleic acid-binding protein
MRKCYECGLELEEIDFHGQKVDRCDKCEGLFFDKGELESILHLVKLFQTIKVGETDIDSVPEHEHRRIVSCPEHNIPMKPLDLAGLTIDQCPECFGLWLDNGEISALKMAENHIQQNIQLYIRLGE